MQEKVNFAEENLPVLTEIFREQMQDLLHAESQLVKAPPKMAKAANNPELSPPGDTCGRNQGTCRTFERDYRDSWCQAESKTM